MRFCILVIVSFLLSACCEIHNEIKYSFGGTEITRLDECGRTSFTYYTEDGNNAGVVWTEYSGINDGFSGYLKFDHNGKVTLLVGDGYFQSKNLDTTKFKWDYVYAYNKPDIAENVCYIMLSTRYEQEFNKNEGAGVNVNYKNSK